MEFPSIRRNAFLEDPAAAPLDRFSPAGIGQASRKFAVAPHDPQAFPVGVPLPILRKEEAGSGLAVGKPVEGPFYPVRQADAEQGMQNEGGVAEPESFVGVGTGVDLSGRMEEKGADGGFVQVYEPGIGDLEKGAARERLPPVRSPGTCGNRTGITFQGDAQADLLCSSLPDGEQDGRSSHADIAMNTRTVVRLEEPCVHVGASVVGEPETIGTGVEQYLPATTDPPAGHVRLPADVMDKAYALGVVRTQGDHKPGIDVAPGTDRHPAAGPSVAIDYLDTGR